jgi:hypothetical protein
VPKTGRVNLGAVSPLPKAPSQIETILQGKEEKKVSNIDRYSPKRKLMKKKGAVVKRKTRKNKRVTKRKVKRGRTVRK